MHFVFTIIFSGLILSTLKTPVIQSTIAGEYYLQGVMETASGFKLNPDSSFQFFFIYGAVDRMGEGSWTVKDDIITFNSSKKPAHDYALVKSEAGKSDEIVIRMNDANEMMSRYLYCIIKGDGKEQQSPFEDNGTVRFAAQPLDTISILFEFAPEKISTFNIVQKDHRYFEFRSEPWIMDVFFQDFKLDYKGDHLQGAHPLLNGVSYTFQKK